MKRISSPQEQEIIKILLEMESQRAEYPADLLEPRRASFLKQVDLQTQVQEEVAPEDQKVIQMLGSLKSLDASYPENLLASRRAAFKRRILQPRPTGFWQRLRLALQSKLAQPIQASRLSTANGIRISLVVAGVLAAMAVFLLYGNRTPLGTPVPMQQQPEVSQAGALFATTTPEVKKIVCKAGFVPPLCLAREFDQNDDLTFQGNGSARPAVAKDTLPGYGEIHQAANINDGRYGPGASWVSKSKHSWIKIDLGKATTVNTVTFGRDRLGQMNDGDPGRFTISVALRDDVYADGNSTNDNLEYTRVYDSQQAGFDGEISGAETVVARFAETPVRFVKLTFENAGTAIDEVEVFLMKIPATADPTRAAGRDPLWTATALPTSTPLPTNTPLPTSTDTPLPTDTATPEPTYTPVPTDTPTVEPSSTPVPTDTLVPTDTPLPMDTQMSFDVTPTLQTVP